jgi:hypothetical protein
MGTVAVHIEVEVLRDSLAPRGTALELNMVDVDTAVKKR